MRFLPTPLYGAFLVQLDRHEDERGYFARSFCQREFAERGLNGRIVQTNISFNRQRGTLRGLHFQVAPHEEAKTVRCTKGAIWDVIVDLRERSSTRFQWFGTELTSDNNCSLYVPEGFAHGFQTLTDDCEVLYLMSEFYHPESSCGLRWDDPRLAISWPLATSIMSDKDRSYSFLP